MHTVIVAGSLGADRPWTNGIPQALLPLPSKSLFENLVDKLLPASRDGLTICVHERNDPVVAGLNGRVDGDRLAVLEDSIPRGTGGCLKACETRSNSDVFLLVGGSVWLDDDPEWLVEQHRRSGNAVTVFCEHNPGWTGPGNERHLVSAGIFCCNRELFPHIRSIGFQDLKEQVIPSAQRAGLQIGAIRVERRSCQVCDWAAYLKVLSYEISALSGDEEFHQLAPDIWCGEQVQIASDARIVGPAIVGSGCTIGPNALLVGPLLLGKECEVEQDAWLVRVVAPPQVRFRQGCALTDRLIPSRREIQHGQATSRQRVLSPSKVRQDRSGLLQKLLPSRLTMPAVFIGLIVGAFTWAFSDTLSNLYRVLNANPDYSGGLLVPFAAGYMVMARRELLARLRIRPSWRGALFFCLGLVLHTVGTYLSFSSLTYVGLVTCTIGLIWSLVGTPIARRMTYPLLMLYLACPLPHRIRDLTILPLQTLCAKVSATVLDVLGIPIERYGHVLEVAGEKIAVAEACSGLRLALAFLLVTSVVAYVIDRPRWQKVIVVLSCVPIALACNVARVVFSAILYYLGHPELAQGAFHDGAGLIMMPLALVMILLEFRLLANLVVPRLPALVEERPSIAAP